MEIFCPAKSWVVLVGPHSSSWLRLGGWGRMAWELAKTRESCDKYTKSMPCLDKLAELENMVWHSVLDWIYMTSWEILDLFSLSPNPELCRKSDKTAAAVRWHKKRNISKTWQLLMDQGWVMAYTDACSYSITVAWCKMLDKNMFVNWFLKYMYFPTMLVFTGSMAVACESAMHLHSGHTQPLFLDMFATHDAGTTCRHIPII